jgi:hypothetical protein
MQTSPSTPFSPTAVCIVRSEPRGDGTRLITVVTTRDIERSADGETHRVTDPGRAGQIVADFLRDLEQDMRGIGPI